MPDFLEILTHGRRLKSQVKELSLDELQEVIGKLQAIAIEREEQDALEQQANAERFAKIDEIRQQLESAGISIDELNSIGMVSSTKAKRAPRPAKYEYFVDGERFTWTGQGRTPKQIDALIQSGEAQSKEDFLIK